MKTLLRRAATGLIIAGLLGFVVCYGMSLHVKDQRDILDEEGAPPEVPLDCILVLGCGLKPDGSPSNMLEDRLKVAIRLYKAGWADKLLMTGDGVSREGYDEVATMTAYALANGVPEEAIVQDPAGLTTYDSLYRARDLYAVRTMVVVTQEYHLHRALYLSKALGMWACGVSADLRPYRAQLYREFREIFARDKAVIWGRLEPKAKIMDGGEPFGQGGPLGA